MHRKTCPPQHSQPASALLDPYHPSIRLARMREHTPRQRCGTVPLAIAEGECFVRQRDAANDDKTNHQPDDAIARLTSDHRQVRALFQQYADTSDPYLKQIIAEHVFAELTLHMLLEETVFYPAVAEQADEEGQRLISDALQD